MVRKSSHSQATSTEAKARIAAHLARSGLKRSKVRDAVVDAFLASSGHVSVEELTELVRRRSPAVGYTTVYRTMKLLSDCGIAAPHNFGDGQTRYEQTVARVHHDHLICTACGAILEFEDRAIEELQDAVARRHDFELESHKTELYGRCAECVAVRRGPAFPGARAARAGRSDA